MTQTPAGWHPAPDRPDQLRYWNGQEWTAHYAPVQPLEVLATAPSVHRPMVLSDQRHNAGLVILAWVLTVCTLGYMLPWAIAETRGRQNSGAIGLLNFLLGWSVIGWIVALVMACGAHQKFAA